jgi:molybdopterin molybdotransferase
MATGFRGESYVFQSPAHAVAGMVSHVDAVSGIERTTIDCALGRVLAQSIAADRDSPFLDHSAMDGYAVHAAGLSASHEIVIEGEARIGHAPPALSRSSNAVRISTGAPMPRGSDAVVRREDVTTCANGALSTLRVSAEVIARTRAGTNVRRSGENARTGDCVLQAGTVLNAAAIGTLAAVGCVTPTVRAQVRVAVISTGDELVEAHRAPGEFQLRDSNGPAICAVLSPHAWLRVVSVQQVHDKPDALQGAIKCALETSDAVVLTGGVSMGHRDPVRGAIESNAGRVIFHGVPQRPGKPMLGAIANGVPVFGLPGNPVSAMVTCVRLVRPVLAARSGATAMPAAAFVEVANADGAQLELWWHRLVRMRADGRVELLDGRGSGDLVAGGRSDGFIEVAPNHATNSWVPFYAWPS